MGNIARFLIRVSAFLRKEIFEILRQPRLVLTLVLGPFLILLLFGIGFRNTAPPLRTLYVIESDSPFRGSLEEYVTDIGPQLLFAGVTDDLNEAQRQLRRDAVDVVVELPERPYETVRESQQAIFTLYHDEVDPFQADYIRVFGRVYVDELNRRILTNIAEQGQTEGSSLQDTLGVARQSTGAVRQALEEGDAVAARQHQTDLDSNIALIALALASDTRLLSNIESTFGGDRADERQELAELLAGIQEATNALDNIRGGQNDYSEEIEQATRIEEDLGQLEAILGEFQSISPTVLISPFRSEIEQVARVEIRLTDFYAPGVIALLVQHIAVTFAALSIVRERRDGAIDLFRVSPLSPFETLLGKYISYFIFEALLALILTGLLIYGLRVPMLGNWTHYTVILAALIFASLGFGFVISLLAQTTSQAVQFSMIMLLASIFFSGFFLALYLLWQPVRIVSWLLPATYAIQMLQNVMLRGHSIETVLLAGLLAMGLIFFLIAWLLLRRQMQLR